MNRGSVAILAGTVLLASRATLSFAVPLTIDVVDEHEEPTQARLHVRDSSGWVPDGPDADLKSRRHWPTIGVYFPVDGSVTLDVQAGHVDIVAGRGFESTPQTVGVDVPSTTHVTITIPRQFDLQALGWHSGDVHVHSHHAPTEYSIEAEDVRLVLEAEDLNVGFILDNQEVTNGPHPLSDDDHQFRYSVEYRNQAYGHVALLGLDDPFGTSCCLPPAGAYPLLSDLRESWDPGYGQAMVLCHPRTGADFFDDSGWPAWGLGREAPVLATTGNLDAYDIASHSNEGDVVLDDWYRLLSSGLEVDPSAGTDTSIDQYWSRPVGSYRVYTYTGQPTANMDEWVEALKAGRSFVTNYPLISTFTVDGNLAGSAVALPQEGGQVLVSFRVLSVLPLEKAEVIVGGEVYSTHSLAWSGSFVNQAVNLWVDVEESTWIAVRVSGLTEVWHADGPALFAHTSPVYVETSDAYVRDPDDAKYFLDWCRDLHTFVDDRGGWSEPTQADHVHGRIEGCATYFRQAFETPPSAVSLLLPVEGDTLGAGIPTTFAWTTATDSDPGDELSYRLEVANDTANEAISLDTGPDSSTVVDLGDRFVGTCRWRAVAMDLAGNEAAPPEWRILHLDPGAAEVAPASIPEPVSLSFTPNPFRYSTALRLVGAANIRGLDIFDASGRRVRHLVPTEAGLLTWDGRRTGGDVVPAGTYWASLSTDDGRHHTRITKLR